MRTLTLIFVCFWTRSLVIAATFVGQEQAIFVVTEQLDGTRITVNKSAPANYELTTDYAEMRWSVAFDVDLLMAGGPTMPFETRLLAKGNLTSRRCVSSCSLAGLGAPSPFTFPDGTGRAGAGSFVLTGSAEWTVTDRIATAIRERHSPTKAILGTGLANGTTNNATSPGNHYLSVLDYPNSVRLETQLSNVSSWQSENGQWEFSFASGVHLGQIRSGNNYLEVTMPFFPSSATLQELLPGDFNDSGAVDAADYVTWRKGNGLLSGFLSRYDVWRSNYGDELGASPVTALPEPRSLALLLIVGLLPFGRLRR